MPTIKAEVTAPTFRTEITRSRLTIELPERHMRVEISDAGEVYIAQESRDILNGAPSAPDFPRYVPGGQYEFTLPDIVDVNKRCSASGADPASLPATGTFTIDAIHRH